MQTVSDIPALRELIQAARRTGKTIGVVPTMGAFHEGHLTLMHRAKAECDLCVVTLFVNPTQFNDPSDFAKYPRDTVRDTQMAEAAGVAFVFAPTPEMMYPPGFQTVVTVPGLSENWEGASRPGHFAGVATVVAKLLNAVQADKAFFGEKDWQQLQVVRRLTADLNIPTQIIGVPTIREADGLALSSRNIRLSPEQRQAATVISRSLREISNLASAGEHDAKRLATILYETISAEPLARLDYAVLMNPGTLEKVSTVEPGTRALVAATFGAVRLIDNAEVG